MSRKHAPSPHYRIPTDAPPGLWRLVVIGLGLVLTTIAATVLALSLGAADPRPAGRLTWEMDFRARDDCLGFVQTNSPAWHCGEAGLTAAPSQNASFALAQFSRFPLSLNSFTFEIAAAQTAGETSALYGVVFDYSDEANYSALVVNGNGYARAYRVEGGAERDWFALAQWPPVRVGTQANRLRVDENEGRIMLWINDEPLIETPNEAEGELGLIAHGFAPGQTIVFQEARLWGE